MNRKPRTVFVIATVAIIVAAIVSVVVRISLAESDGIRAAKADFEELTISLDGVRGPRDLADPGERLKLSRHYAASAGLLLAVVRERGKGVTWRIPDRSPYLPASENTQPDPRILHPDRSTVLLETPLRGDSSGKLVLEALYVAIPQTSVFAAFRDAALGLGLWLLVAIILILVLGSGNEAEATWRVGGPASPSMTGETKGGSKEPDFLDANTALGDAEINEEFEAEASAEADLLQPRMAASSKGGARGVDSLETDLEAISVQPEGSEAGEPQGLFSPLSGLGWESYLADRLEAELSRSASFEQDLSILLVSFEGLAPGDSTYALLSKTIAEFFSFKDLAFERGSDGFAVVLPNLDAEHGLRMAEEFHKKVSFLIREEGFSAPLASLPLSIGLSSRAGRLVEAGRLLGEAEIALIRAKEEDTKILAFKPDPDKYRLYLASKGI